jgi:GTPase
VAQQQSKSIMTRKKIAIVGRPNVGKSSIFNCICKKRLAIVDEIEGVTRDRLYAKADIFGKNFEVIDTGGIDIFSKNLDFNEEIKRQAYSAITEADAIIFVVDVTCGITKLDKEIAKIILKTKKQVVLAINKVDDLSKLNYQSLFYPLGVDQMICVSASHNYNIAEMLLMATQNFDDKEEGVTPSSVINLAIVGRANVGKSTLLNTILEEERVVVSPIAGTTRDSIDVALSKDGKDYLLIDTAGIRRRNKEKLAVDKFAFIRTKEAIDRSDICLLLLDANKGMTTQDRKIFSYIEEIGKGCVIVFNKWDLVKGYRMEHCSKCFYDAFPFYNSYPLIFMSAKTGRNVDKVFSLVEEIFGFYSKKFQTSELNKCIEKAMNKTPPPMIKGKRLRVYYTTQVANSPPKFILFVNKPLLVTKTYKRYLINQMRKYFLMLGAPLVFEVKGKSISATKK